MCDRGQTKHSRFQDNLFPVAPVSTGAAESALLPMAEPGGAQASSRLPACGFRHLEVQASESPKAE